MSKIWLVAEQQFKKEVFKRGFLLALIAMPLFLGFTAAMGWLGERMRQETTTLGYVDQGNALGQMPADLDDQVRLVRFDTPEAARAALESGQIDAYYALPPDYPQDHAHRAGILAGVRRWVGVHTGRAAQPAGR